MDSIFQKRPPDAETTASPQTARLLAEIQGFCRAAKLAESTFGRLAINDGKLVSRLRDGAQITTATYARVMRYIGARAGGEAAARLEIETAPAAPASQPRSAPHEGFRFFDNRQKYLLFVSTCGEKTEVARRVTQELANISPRPPAVRVFDAGVGDGTVLTKVMRSMHARFPTMPFYIVGKEISYEDVRLTLEKMADRFFEHPSTVLVLTNLYYAEAPWLTPKTPEAARGMLWKDVVLSGNSSHAFEEQITALAPFLHDNWRAGISSRTGNPVYQRPVVLTLHREDHSFLLDPILPKPGRVNADYDLVIASQPYRARASAKFKAEKVVAPLARALAPGGRLIGIHSKGGDPGSEIIESVWPGDNPFVSDRHAILREVKLALGKEARHFNLNANADARSVFRYDMHTLPDEVSGPIGTSTLFAAWNAAIYVSQVEDQRVSQAVTNARYLEQTDKVLKKHGGLWFYDETYVVSRRKP